MAENHKLQQLFSAHVRQVQGFFRRRVLRRDEVSDLSQEVFLRLLRVEDLECIDDPQRYLFTVAGNLLKERAHSQRRRGESVSVPIEDVLNAPELSVEPQEDRELDVQRQVQQLRQILGGLAEREREALRLVYEERLSYREIARQWGVSRSMVEKVVARATARCRKQMDSLGAS